jgi:hypothetical protein
MIEAQKRIIMGNPKNVVINTIEVSLHSNFIANDDNYYIETLPGALYLNSADTVTFHYNHHGLADGRICEITGGIFGSNTYTLKPNSSTKPIALNSPLNGRYNYNLTFRSKGGSAKPIVVDPEIIDDDHTPVPPKRRAKK